MNRLLKNRLSRNTLVLLVGNTGSAGLSFLLSVLVGRVPGAAGLGVYAGVLAWVFPLSLLTEFGLGTLITRDVAQDISQSDAYLKASVRARLLIGGGLFVLLWILAPDLSDNPVFVRGLRVSAPMIVMLPLYSSFTAIFRARQIMQPIAILNLGMLVTQVTLTALVFTAGGSIIAALIVNTVTSAGQLVAAWWIYRRYFYHPAEQQIALLPLLKRGMPFAIAAVLAAVQARLALILLEQFTDAVQVGLYAAAYRFIEAGRMMPHALFDALFPRLSELAKKPDALQKTFFRVSVGLFAFGLCFAIGMLLLAEWILNISYGAAFVPATLSLQILGVAFMPMLLRQGRILYAYALQKEQHVNFVILMMVFLQGILSVMLIPAAGMYGAALVILITEFAGMLLIWLIS